MKVLAGIAAAAMCLPLTGQVNTVQLTSTQNFNAIVNQAPAGTRFVLAPGIYRGFSVNPKDGDVFDGQAGVVLSGAKQLQLSQDGNLLSFPFQRNAWGPGHCDTEHPHCWILNDVYVDGHLYRAVASQDQVGPGTSYYDDDAKKFYLPPNVAGNHTVEVATQMAAFAGNARNVQLSNLIVEKYASAPQHGAIGGAAGTLVGWKIDNVEARWNHGAGIAVGANSVVSSCNIHHNGQLGMGASGENILIENNEIAFNNYAGYDIGWEAGGTKFSNTDHLIVRGNDSHDNLGTGLWTDIDNVHVLYENNRSINNKTVGIHHEISYDAIIRNNIVEGNHDGILIVLSANVQVYGNKVTVPPDGLDGIRVASGQRGSGRFGAHVSHDVSVHDNVIVFLGPKGRAGLSGPPEMSPNVQFNRNEYHVRGGGNQHFMWAGRQMSMDQAKQEGHEADAKVIRAH